VEGLNKTCSTGEGKAKGYFKEFLICPNGRIISEKKKSAFVCPKCGSPLCWKEDLKAFPDNYCGECGHELASAIEEAMALDEKEK